MRNARSKERPRSDNVVLIGMPGSGKSTVGVILAKELAWDFVDTDVLIQRSTGRPLQETVDGEGFLNLREIEERVLLDLRCRQTVIATGGSAVYSPVAMRHLRTLGPAVFLDVPFAEIERRVRDFDTRGIARRPDQSFRDLYEERRPLYQKYADLTVAAAGKAHEEVCAAIRRRLRPRT